MHINKNHIHRKVSKVEFSSNGNLLHSTQDTMGIIVEKNTMTLFPPFIALFQPHFGSYLMSILYKSYAYRLARKLLEMKNAFQQ